MAKKSNGWPADRQLVLFRLKTIEDQGNGYGRTLTYIREDIAALKVKAGIWGLIGGSIPVAILLIANMLKG